MSRPSRVRSLVSWGVFAGLVVAGVLIWNNRTALADDFRLINYTPPSDVAVLAQTINFTPEGQRYFYVAHPSIDGKQAFNAACGSTEVHTTVLGCYVNNSIYIYDVTDSRLSGVQAVTAAHETLHAAYARLSSSERASVDGMLQRQYDSMAGDAGFSARFSVYNSLSQADKLNELHSIFGTEIPSLSNELNNYYAQYFQNRGTITGFYTAYQGQFDALKNQQATLKAKILSLKTTIESTEASYTSDRQQLNTDIRSFNQRANGNGYSSQTQFDSDRSALAARSDALNATARTINTAINDYNEAINQYNALTIQTQDLQNSLDSQSVESAPSV